MTWTHSHAMNNTTNCRETITFTVVEYSVRYRELMHFVTSRTCNNKTDENRSMHSSKLFCKKKSILYRLLAWNGNLGSSHAINDEFLKCIDDYMTMSVMIIYIYSVEHCVKSRVYFRQSILRFKNYKVIKNLGQNKSKIFQTKKRNFATVLYKTFNSVAMWYLHSAALNDLYYYKADVKHIKYIYLTIYDDFTTFTIYTSIIHPCFR